MAKTKKYVVVDIKTYSDGDVMILVTGKPEPFGRFPARLAYGGKDAIKNKMVMKLNKYMIMEYGFNSAEDAYKDYKFEKSNYSGPVYCEWDCPKSKQRIFVKELTV